MMISSSAWARFIRRLSAISNKAADETKSFIEARGGLQFVERNDLIDFAYGLSTKYGEAAAALAAEMYDAVAATSEAAVQSAVPAETATVSEVAKAINGTIGTGDADIIAQTVYRMVKLAGVDTTTQNALRDGAEWAWIPQGDTCPFCLMLASQDWQPASKKAIKNGHAEHIHANCDCTYAIRFNKSTNVQGYTPKRYLRMYEQAPRDQWNTKDGKPPAGHEKAEEDTPKNRLNAMRRSYYAEHKTRINDQKREAYAERKEREA